MPAHPPISLVMSKEELKVLIVEDDPTLGKALSELVSRMHFKPLLTGKPDEALTLIKLQTVHFAIIDCMLPKMNGRDLALKLREESSSDLPIVLTSGIYKDKAFSREAIKLTGALAFLTKPFALDEVATLLEKNLAHVAETPLSPIHDLFTKVNVSGKERIKAINDTEQVHGFDLPWLYSLLLDHGISGHLNIINADGDVAGVGFHKGNIVQVNLKDTKSYFGVLLMEMGFISSNDLNEVLAMTGTKRMGERLVEYNVLSPHAIQIVVAEQQAIRLSKTVANTSVRVNFVDSSEMTANALIDRNSFCESLDNWIGSKITMEWLRALYMPWLRHSLRKGSAYTNDHRVFGLPILRHTPGLIDKLTDGQTTIEQLLATSEYTEDHLYRALHLLILSRTVVFGEQKATTNFTHQKKRLEKMNAQLDKQNFFDRLGVSPKATDSEIKRAYHDLAKALHPDKLGAGTPDDVLSLTKDAFRKISDAYETLSEQDKRSVYVKELEFGKAEKQLQATTLAENGRAYLGKGEFQKAGAVFEEAASMAPPSSELKLLILWAKVKNARPKSARIIESVKDELSGIPPEDRHSATYFYVKALYLRYIGEDENARKTLEHAISIDPDFIDARREIANLKSTKGKNEKPDLFTGELKDVVGMLFKKKK